MTHTSNQQICILHIEDNEGDVYLTQKVFELVGVDAHIENAPDGEAALDMLHRTIEEEPEKTPNLILLDLNLPKKDGFQVLKELKSNDILKAIPVIMLTSSGTNKDVIECYGKQANGYVIKPTDIGQLKIMVQAIDSFWCHTASLPEIE